MAALGLVQTPAAMGSPSLVAVASRRTAPGSSTQSPTLSLLPILSHPPVLSAPAAPVLAASLPLPTAQATAAAAQSTAMPEVTAKFAPAEPVLMSPSPRPAPAPRPALAQEPHDDGQLPEQMRAALTALHLDMLRQFQALSDELRPVVAQASLVEAAAAGSTPSDYKQLQTEVRELRLEAEALRRENRWLRSMLPAAGPSLSPYGSPAASASSWLQ